MPGINYTLLPPLFTYDVYFLFFGCTHSIPWICSLYYFVAMLVNKWRDGVPLTARFALFHGDVFFCAFVHIYVTGCFL